MIAAVAIVRSVVVIVCRVMLLLRSVVFTGCGRHTRMRTEEML
jgi:hypothetical protein